MRVRLLDMELRPAHAKDLDGMVRIDPRAASGNPDRQTYLREALHRDVCFVVVDGDQICGFAVTKRAHFFDRDFVDLLMVGRTHRRRGIGSALMRAVVDASVSPDVFTSTNESNAPMQALLRSGGWSLSDKLEGIDDGDPELVYFINR